MREKGYYGCWIKGDLETIVQHWMVAQSEFLNGNFALFLSFSLFSFVFLCNFCGDGEKRQPFQCQHGKEKQAIHLNDQQCQGDEKRVEWRFFLSLTRLVSLAFGRFLGG